MGDIINTINDFTNIDFSSFSSFLSSLSPLEFGTLGCVIGLLISSNLSSDALDSLGNFLELVGQVMLTCQAQMPTPMSNESKNEFNAIRNEIRKMYSDFINYINKK